MANLINVLIMIVLIPIAFSFTLFVVTIISVAVDRFKSNRFKIKES